MYDNNGKKIFGAQATNTDAAGNGYYRDRNGDYYYGNKQNGYLTPTKDTLRRREEKNSWSNQNNQTYSSRSASAARPSVGEAFLMSACFKIGYASANAFIKLMNILWAVGKVVASAILILVIFTGYADFCPIIGSRHAVLNILFVLLMLVTFIGGIVLTIKNKSDYSTAVFVIMAVATLAVSVLNLGDGIIANLIMGAIIAYFYVQLPRVILGMLAKFVTRG